jgi:hypothetical protein
VSGASGKSYDFTFGMRFIPDVIDRAKWRNTLMWHAHPRITLGVEYNPLVDGLQPLANLTLLRETSAWPAIIAGTSSDRIGTLDGQAYYLTFSKDLEAWTSLPIAPYVGACYGSFDEELIAIGGLNVRLSDHLSAMGIFDGHKVHPTITWSKKRWAVGLMLAFGTKPGLFVNYRF